MKTIFSYDDKENDIHILPEIVLTGNSEMTVDSLKEITEYSGEKLCLSLGKLNVTLLGESLEIRSLGTERLTVSGNILSLSFSS